MNRTDDITDHGFGCIIDAATLTNFGIVSCQKRLIKMNDGVSAFACSVIFMQDFIGVGDV